MAATDAGAIADEVHPLLRAVPHAFLGLSPLFPTLCWVILLFRTFVWRTSMEMQCSSCRCTPRCSSRYQMSCIAVTNAAYSHSRRREKVRKIGTPWPVSGVSHSMSHYELKRTVSSTDNRISTGHDREERLATGEKGKAGGGRGCGEPPPPPPGAPRGFFFC